MNVIPFQFENFTLCAVVVDGCPWFNANELCAALSFGNPRQAIESHVDPDDVQKLDTIDTLGRRQHSNHVNESGLYALILGSKKPEAKRFKRWVTGEVLPAIRTTGGYQVARKTRLPQPQAVRDLLLIGKAMAKIRGVDESLAMAYTLDAIETVTGLPARAIGKALPSVDPEQATTLNATQVGAPLGISSRAANHHLERMGMLFKDGEQWKLTNAGTAFGEMKPFHRNGHSGYEIRWKPAVVNSMRHFIESTRTDRSATQGESR